MTSGGAESEEIMSDYRYYAKPGIDMSGLVPDDAERLTCEQMEELLAEITAEAEENDTNEAEEPQA